MNVEYKTVLLLSEYIEFDYLFIYLSSECCSNTGKVQYMRSFIVIQAYTL